MIDELPRGWASVSLGELGAYFNGRAFKPSEWEQHGLPIIRIQNLNDLSAPFNYSRKKFDERVRVKNGDLLIAWSASLGAFIWNGGDAWLNQHIFRVEHNASVCTKHFLYYSVRHALDDLYLKAHGSGMVHVTKPVFEAQQVPLPPIPEQQRIVAKLEQLLGKVGDCRKRVSRVPAFLARFRRSVLAAACSGRLTAEWRDKNLGDVEIDSMLSSIEHRQYLSAKSVAQKEKFREIFSVLEEGNSEEIPDNWRFVRLNKLVTSFNYGTSAKSKRSGKIPVLRMGNLQGGAIDWSDLAYTSDVAEIRQYSLSPQTVLFNRTNSPELVGKTAIYRGERPAIFAGYLIRINLHVELNAEYLNLCLNTSYAREFCASVKTDGVSQSNINAQKLGTFEVPFCHPAEQQEIVRRVGGLFSLADKIEARFKIIQRQVDRLPQSILAKAFRGELVPTEAELAEREGRAYESAEQLLQRIQSSHNAVPASVAKKRGKRSTHR